MLEPCEHKRFQASHARLLSTSFLRLTGSVLPALADNPDDPARALYESRLAVVSHNTDSDPVFNYANLAAQHAFEMPWQDITRLPSRRSVAPDAREDRQRLMRQVTLKGFVTGYSGLRISASGRRFSIDHATIWNVIDEAGVYRGQAAIFELTQTA
jgi:hypothetical protein